MVDKLEACPFCGGEAEIIRKASRVMVICPSAGPVCMTLRSESYGNDDAITAWNTRAFVPCARVTKPNHVEVANAIKATEYKYFGDYEMSDDQREAVDVLVRFAQAYATPANGEQVERADADVLNLRAARAAGNIPTPTEDARERVKALEGIMQRLLAEADQPAPDMPSGPTKAHDVARLANARLGIALLRELPAIRTALGNKETDRHG